MLASSPQIDSDRAVAASASHGGYPIKLFFALIPCDCDKDVPSWIQSNSGFGFELKAFVCHDRVFDCSIVDTQPMSFSSTLTSR
ncbi:hypothetical protein BDM02DRAFT_3113293 [Thelephora ganbajun]|uniref:Uncharacterized protein n=1 Tax=Thelephora ganbajun TaxID=370292 RepID=A0ACB6ZJ12_THEGA|nr:hypothetical protein BDM02DRAFT_3113293 [Thelephora ganbajun]